MHVSSRGNKTREWLEPVSCRSMLSIHKAVNPLTRRDTCTLRSVKVVGSDKVMDLYVCDVPEIDDDDELAVELAKYYLEGCVDFHSAVRYGRRRCRVIINGAALISN